MTATPFAGPPRRRPGCRHATAIVFAIAVICLAGSAEAQNDWQYPDPYFGILEIEKSHDSATWRRYRAEVNPPPRHDAAATRSPSATLPAEQVAPSRSTRFRWRNRTRR